MSKIDYQALREAAEKATCGAWSLEYGEERFDAGDALIHREVVGYLPICRIEGAHPESGFDEDFQMEQQANAEFIAAANPATVLALLDERERNRQYIKRRDQENEEIALTVGKLRVELEAAKSKLNEQREYYEGVIADGSKRIAELESLKEPRLPHPALVVPDEMTPKQASRSYCGEVRGYRDGWNACRAAMLQSGNFRENKNSSTNNFREIAETSTNYPVIPSEVLSAIQKVARVRADFDDFDGDRRGIGDCLDEAEQELIVTINKHAGVIAVAPQRGVNK